MVTYEDLLSRMNGQEFKGYFRARCPFHDDSSPSLLVYRDGWFRCLGCLRNGRWQTLDARLRGSPAPHLPERRTHWGPPNVPLESLEEVCYQAHLDLLRFDSLKWYYEMRGIEDRIEANELGYWEGWCTIPVWDSHHSFLTAVFRAAPHVERATGERYWCPSSPTMFVPDWNLLLKSDQIYVVFGIFDALCLSALRLPVATSTAGLNFDPHWLDGFRKNVVIIPDRGEEVAASKLARHLGWRGRIRRLEYPWGMKDPADFFKAGRVEDLRRQLL